jgi:hypothetical protein
MAEKVYWVTPEGGTLDLTDGTQYNIRQGIDGRHMPTFTYYSDKMFTFPGEVLRGITTDKRTITLPILVKGTSPEDFRNNQRFLEYSLDPMRGQGFLKVVTDDATPKTRLLPCHYAGGMSYVESGDTGNYRNRIYVLQFVAHQPYWFDPNWTQIFWTDPAASLRAPQVVFNPGDVDAWPIINIIGPLQVVTITNETTGKYITWGYSGSTYLPAGVRMLIDCRPGNRSCCVSHWIYTPNGPPCSYGNVFKYASAYSSFNFNLVPGENRISFQMTQGSYDSGAMVGFRWVNKYNGV